MFKYITIDGARSFQMIRALFVALLIVVAAAADDTCIGVHLDGVDFRIAYDEHAPDSHRWPVYASVPFDRDAMFVCDKSGAITLSSVPDDRNEFLHMRWLYRGLPSVSCDQFMITKTDFVSFEVEAKYIGRGTVGFYSTSDEHSLARLMHNATSCKHSFYSRSCSTAQCRFMDLDWRRSSAAKATYCGITFEDILDRRGIVRKYGAEWLAQADAMIECELTAALNNCPVPYDMPFVAHLRDYLENSANCGSDEANADELRQLLKLNARAVSCERHNRHARNNNASVNTGLLVTMIIFIVIAVLLFGLIVYMCLAMRTQFAEVVMAHLCCDPNYNDRRTRQQREMMEMKMRSPYASSTMVSSPYTVTAPQMPIYSGGHAMLDHTFDPRGTAQVAFPPGYLRPQ